MNLDTIPDLVWLELALCARLAVKQQTPVRELVRDVFYNQIYSKWSQGAVSYQSNVEGEDDPGWDELVIEWVKIAQASKDDSLGKVLGDNSVGKAYAQGEIEAGKLKGVRLWEKYNGKKGDRFQFVVNSGGGMVLFNRMRQACQRYILDHLKGDQERSAVHGWKVFSETQGKGRSDSCVVYLACAYDDPEVTQMVHDYIWPNVQDLVDANFKPIGFYSVDHQALWAMPLPDVKRGRQVLGVTLKGSAGGLMGHVLGLAFEQAAPVLDDDPAGLAERGKAKAAEIVKALYA
jgi:hypothetical protein